jgi:hypothetical protein
MARIKGFAIRGLFRYLKENSPGRAAAVVATLSPETQKVLERPIVSSNMYPYPVFGELLRAIDRDLGRGDLKRCELIGEFAAEQDINGMFKIMMSVFSPKTLLDRANIFWSKYCDTGKLHAVDSDPRHSVLRLDSFPDIDEAHCFLMTGWERRFAAMANARNVNVKHTVCVHHGGSHCQWDGSWEM